MEFKSSRLVFREFTPGDYGAFSSVFSDGQVMKYAYMDVITDEKDLLAYFNKVLANNTSTDRDFYEYAVYLASDGSFIGFADIMLRYHLLRLRGAEIGYFLLKEFWGRGYATEIANILIDVCFGELKLQKVEASCNANNRQSEKVMKKSGMTREGVIRRARYKDGVWNDELRYGILFEEWEDQKKLRTGRKKLSIVQADPFSSEALSLMDELSASLESITGNSGRGSCDPRDVCVPRALFAIARSESGEAVGCGALRPLDDTTAEIKRMYARIKGMGIGTSILAYLEEQALELGYSALRLETRLVNEKAVAFYESRGYRRIPNYGRYEGRPEAGCFEKLIL